MHESGHENRLMRRVPPLGTSSWLSEETPREAPGEAEREPATPIGQPRRRAPVGPRGPGSQIRRYVHNPQPKPNPAPAPPPAPPDPIATQE